MSGEGPTQVTTTVKDVPTESTAAISDPSPVSESVAFVKLTKRRPMRTPRKYTEPAKPMSGEGPTQVTTTVKDYDLAEASKAIRGRSSA
jgi:hypothetical protein